MLFSSFSFLLFLPLAIAVLAIARYQSQPALLTAMILVSLVFYGWFRADYVLILIGSALVNYSLAAALDRWPDKGIFAAGVIFNVALLGAFKISRLYHRKRRRGIRGALAFAAHRASACSLVHYI
jgi:alginate O-acetyltransferase complex protein AlgI